MAFKYTVHYQGTHNHNFEEREEPSSSKFLHAWFYYDLKDKDIKFKIYNAQIHSSRRSLS